MCSTGWSRCCAIRRRTAGDDAVEAGIVGGDGRRDSAAAWGSGLIEIDSRKGEMMDEQGYSPLFYVMLLIGIIGLIGLLVVGGGAAVGGM